MADKVPNIPENCRVSKREGVLQRITDMKISLVVGSSAASLQQGFEMAVLEQGEWLRMDQSHRMSL